VRSVNFLKKDCSRGRSRVRRFAMGSPSVVGARAGKVPRLDFRDPTATILKTKRN